MKVGDYVRTDKGLIGKVIKKEEYDTHVILEYEGQYCKRVLSTSGNDSEIIKSSPNIIDLIEAGDIVVIINGLNKEELILIKDLKREKPILESHKIKSIVTKEQFESMEYKVGE